MVSTATSACIACKKSLAVNSIDPKYNFDLVMFISRHFVTLLASWMNQKPHLYVNTAEKAHVHTCFNSSRKTSSSINTHLHVVLTFYAFKLLCCCLFSIIAFLATSDSTWGGINEKCISVCVQGEQTNTRAAEMQSHHHVYNLQTVGLEFIPLFSSLHPPFCYVFRQTVGIN